MQKCKSIHGDCPAKLHLLAGCMTHTTPGGSLAPDMNTQALTYLPTYLIHAYLLDLPCRVRE